MTNAQLKAAMAKARQLDCERVGATALRILEVTANVPDCSRLRKWAVARALAYCDEIDKGLLEGVNGKARRV